MIQIVQGIYGHREGDSIYPRTPKDPPFSLSPEKEKRLVDRGVARYVGEQQTEASDMAAGPRAYSEDMKLVDLKEIAVKDYGCGADEIRSMVSKAAVIAAIERSSGPTMDADGSDDQPHSTTEAVDQVPVFDPVEAVQ